MPADSSLASREAGVQGAVRRRLPANACVAGLRVGKRHRFGDRGGSGRGRPKTGSRPRSVLAARPSGDSPAREDTLTARRRTRAWSALARLRTRGARANVRRSARGRAHRGRCGRGRPDAIGRPPPTTAAARRAPRAAHFCFAGVRSCGIPLSEKNRLRSSAENALAPPEFRPRRSRSSGTPSGGIPGGGRSSPPPRP